MATRSSARVKQLTLVATILGSGIAFLDGTIVNVALPTIQRDLGGGLVAQQWIANAYLLTLGSLILVGGSLGDIFGERRVFALGVGAFAVTSLLCAVSPSVDFLIGARALQGVAGALLTPSALAVIVATFPPAERGKAIGSWTAWGGIATVIGPLGGGELLNVASWRWIFIVNLPFAAICLALILGVMPQRQTARDRGKRVDVVGAVLGALGLAGPVFALIEQPRLGWGSPGVIVPLIAGVALFVSFLVYERRARDPMLPLTLFRSRNFAIGNLETLSMYAGLSILFFFLTLFLQQVAGYSPLKSGLATLPTTLILFALSRRFGGLADRFGPRFFMGVGPLLAATGLVLMLRVNTHFNYWTVLLPALILFSLGLSMTVAPLTAAVLAGVDESQAGIASGVNNAIARVAGLFGTAAVGAIVAAQFGHSLDTKLRSVPLDRPGRHVVAEAKRLPLGRPPTGGLPQPEARAITNSANDASVTAFRIGMGISAALVAAGGTIAAIGIQNPRRRVSAESCAGGQLVGAARDAAGCPLEPDAAAAKPLPGTA